MTTTQTVTTIEHAGTIRADDVLRIADPCYLDRDPLCAPGAEIECAEVGRFHAHVVRADVGHGWGERILRLVLTADAPEPGDIHLDWSEVAGAPVDSGLMCATSDDGTGDVPPGVMTLARTPVMVEPVDDVMHRAVVVTSGLGDGWYPVEVRRTADGRLRAVRVVFIDESELDVEADDAVSNPPPF